MFVYSHFLDVNEIVSILQQSGVASCCFIDECGVTIPSVIQACYTYNLNCCFGAPFSAFMADCSLKQEGYLIATTSDGMKRMYEQVAELKTQAIPYLSFDVLNMLQENHVFLFSQTQDQNEYKNWFSSEQIRIEVVSYLHEHQAKAHQLYGESVPMGLTLHEQQVANEWVNTHASSPSQWKSVLLPSFVEADIWEEIDVHSFSADEMIQIDHEIRFFRHRGMSICLMALAKAKKQGISFVPHGDLFSSLLAYALGIIHDKPSSFHISFNFKKPFHFSIVASKKEQSELLLCIHSISEAKLALTKPVLDLKNVIKKVARSLQLPCEHLLYTLQSSSNLEQFSKTMRTRFLFHEAEKRVFQLSSSLVNIRAKQVRTQSHRIVFVPSDAYIMQFENTAYIDECGIDLMSLACIECLLPPNQEEQRHVEHLLSEGAVLNCETLSFYYLSLRAMIQNHTGQMINDIS